MNAFEQIENENNKQLILNTSNIIDDIVNLPLFYKNYGKEFFEVKFACLEMLINYQLSIKQISNNTENNKIKDKILGSFNE